MSNETITAPKGFRAAGVIAGIKPSGKLDLGLLVADAACAAAGVFTTNKFCGAPVVIGREHVAGGRLRSVVVNSGNANVATGQRGLGDAIAMCRRVAGQLEIDPHDVLPASTGVIGVPLNMDKILPAIDRACRKLSAGVVGGQAFARAILTTDTRTKQALRRVRLGRSSVVVAGCSKGSGMISPNMATTLTYITTDAAVRPAVLRKVLRLAVEPTFNRVTVDGAMSTSDMAVVLASGLADNTTISTADSAAARTLGQALLEVCDELAYMLAADGEGATKVMEVNVSGARSAPDAHLVAREIANNPLLKAAVHFGDPNWGRVIQSAGATDAKFDPHRVSVTIGGQLLFSRGQPNAKPNTRTLAAAMKRKKIVIEVDLGAGNSADRVLTCDLSEEYVRLNGDYTT